MGVEDILASPYNTKALFESQDFALWLGSNWVHDMMVRVRRLVVVVRLRDRVIHYDSMKVLTKINLYIRYICVCV